LILNASAIIAETCITDGGTNQCGITSSRTSWIGSKARDRAAALMTNTPSTRAIRSIVLSSH